MIIILIYIFFASLLHYYNDQKHRKNLIIVKFSKNLILTLSHLFLVISEEYIFRNIIPIILKYIIDDAYIIYICSVMFGLCHMYNNSKQTYRFITTISHIITITILGYYLACLDNIALSIIVHFAYNYSVLCIQDLIIYSHIYLNKNCKICETGERVFYDIHICKVKHKKSKSYDDIPGLLNNKQSKTDFVIIKREKIPANIIDIIDKPLYKTNCQQHEVHWISIGNTI